MINYEKRWCYNHKTWTVGAPTGTSTPALTRQITWLDIIKLLWIVLERRVRSWFLPPIYTTSNSRLQKLYEYILRRLEALFKTQDLSKEILPISQVFTFLSDLEFVLMVYSCVLMCAYACWLGKHYSQSLVLLQEKFVMLHYFSLDTNTLTKIVNSTLLFLPPFFMSRTQRSKTFSMYTKSLFI